jgi:ABC-type sugar transport system ATPase subunit
MRSNSAVRRAADRRCAVIYISHRLGEVLNLCDSVTVMRDGKLVATAETKDLDVRTLIAQMLGSAGETAYSAKPAPRSAELALSQELTISGLSVRPTVESFSMRAQAGRIYGLAGQLGSGSSEILRGLAGLDPTASGTIILDERRLGIGRAGLMLKEGIAFVSNDRKTEGLFLDKTVEENLVCTRYRSLSHAGIISRRATKAESGRLAELLSVDTKRRSDRVRNLSGGNQQKLLIGRCLMRSDVKVLLLDEPTRGVDVGGRDSIHRILRRAADAGTIVIFASSELTELTDLADDIITMWEGRIVGKYHSDVPAAQILADITHRQGPT